MNICKSDIYFVILLFIIFYLNFSVKKPENFQSTTTGYQGDIEAIRNLSNIATQLTSNNTLTMPGILNVSNNLNIGDTNFASGTANANGTANGKMLVFDNTFNGTPGQGIPANKIRLHNNNNTWIAGLGLEVGAQTYHTGDSHRFYVNSGSKYGDLAFTIDGNKNGVFNNDLFVRGISNLGGRSNLVSIFSGSATGNCDGLTIVTHNKNYPNPSKLSIQLTCSRITQSDMFLANIQEDWY
jgi:hypothetical protein